MLNKKVDLLNLNYDFDVEKMENDIKNEKFTYELMLNKIIKDNLSKEENEEIINAINTITSLCSLALMKNLNKLIKENK